MVTIPNPNEHALIKIKSLAHIEQNREPIEVKFFPYDFEFDDSYKPDWGSYDAFGKMDPIMIYKRTTRDVNISFNVVAENEQMAIDNFNNLQKLLKCLYPVYKTLEVTTSAQQAEELQILQDRVATSNDEVENLAPSNQSVLDAQTPVAIGEIQQIEQQITNLNQRQQEQRQNINDFGLSVMHKSPLFQISFMKLLKQEEHVAAITNFKHKMKFDSADTRFSKNGNAIPGEFNINISFKVLHTYTPGTRLNY